MMALRFGPDKAVDKSLMFVDVFNFKRVLRLSCVRDRKVRILVKVLENSITMVVFKLWEYTSIRSHSPPPF